MNFPRKVYMLRHNATGKIYIGSSSKLDKRIQRHLWQLRNGSHNVPDMQSDYNEHGGDYTVTVLDECTCWADRCKEYYWMNVYKSNVRGIGYNYNDHAKTKLRESTKGGLDAGDKILFCNDPNT